HVGQIELPAARADGVAAAHQESIAGVDRRVRIGAGSEGRARRVVEVGNAHRVAAIHDVDQRAAARPRAVHGDEQREVGGKLDEPGGVPRRQRDIGDAAVGGVTRIDRVAQPALQLLVGTHVAERRATGQRTAQRDLEAGDGHHFTSARNRSMAALTSAGRGQRGHAAIPRGGEVMAVTGFEITLRRPLAGGAPFGDVGPYEELKGRLRYAIDPSHAANRGVTDVALAPRNAAGLVEFSADLSLLVPVDPARASGRALIDVVNRGNTVSVPNFNHATRPAFTAGSDPNPPIDVGDGFLMRRGYVVASCGWQFD